MSIWKYKTATATKLARIGEDPRVAVVTELRRGIEAAYRVIRSTDRSDQSAASSDANLAYATALTLMTQAETVITDPFVQQQFRHLEGLLERLDLDTKNA
jgi:hypothetical protein